MKIYRPGFHPYLVAALAGISLAVAPASQAATLYVGGNFGSIDVNLNGVDENAGTGSIGPSSLDSRQLPFMYCIDLEHEIYVPGTYNATVTTNGTAWEASYGPVNLNATLLSGNKTSGPVQLSFTQAGQIAFLVDHYAYSATTLTQQEALQAAIWKQIYGSAFSLGASATTNQIADFNSYLTNVGTAPVSDLLWISPTDSNNNYQQVQITSAVPEPGPVTMFAGICLVGIGLLTRKRRIRRAAANS